MTTEISADEQARMKLRLEEAVDEIVREAILKAFDDPEFYYKLGTSAWWNFTKQNILHGSEFASRVLGVIKEHFGKQFF